MIGIKVIRKRWYKNFWKSKFRFKGRLSVKNYNKDHRVLMMSCVAALTLGGKWKIYDADSSNTSSQIFWYHEKIGSCALKRKRK